MDPLTALGLASNVIQFVDFAGKLTSSAGEIAGSASSATERTIELKTAYSTLQTIFTKLGTTTGDNHGILAGFASINPGVTSHIHALEALAAECKPVCDQLLGVVADLHVKEETSHRRIHSVVTAIRTALAEKKISGLEDRLRRFHNMITLHFLPLLSLQQVSMQSSLEKLREQNRMLQLDQTSKLNELSRNMSDLLQKVQSISTVNHEAFSPQREHAMSHTHIDDAASLENLLSSLSLAENGLVVAATEQVLLRSLNFKSRPYRYENIPEAHKSTFEWIFSSDKSFPRSSVRKYRPKSNADREFFYTWLKSGKGTFWVYGKAGSGKSTLLKFITGHNTTYNALKQWGDGKRVITTEHYFWSAGTAFQKSLAGLLQTLLFDILRRCPELTPEIFPEQWKNTRPGDVPSDKRWNINELYCGLRSLANHPSMPVKICLFIDGLDEYDGDHFELCQFLKELSASDNVKCCVSSRPWNVFEEAFAGDPSRKMCVHDQNFEDIRKFAASRLEHPKWPLICTSKKMRSNFITEIAERAQGVFLWVFLVTLQLRNGLVNGDTMADLHRHLESSPPDLELFFKHMLNLVDPVYDSYMSRTLQMAVHAKIPLNLRTYYCSEYEDRDADYAIRKLPEVDLMLSKAYPYPEMLKPCQLRINARCSGLLDIDSRGKVEFLHRTVRDYLRTRPMHDYREQKMHATANLTIVKAFVFQLRSLLAASNSAGLSSDFGILWSACRSYLNDALDEDEASSIMTFDVVLGISHNHRADNACPFRYPVDRSYLNQPENSSGLSGDGYMLEKFTDSSYGNHPLYKPRIQTFSTENGTGCSQALGFCLWHTLYHVGAKRFLLARLQSQVRPFIYANETPLLRIIEYTRNSGDRYDESVSVSIMRYFLGSGVNINNKDEPQNKTSLAGYIQETLDSITDLDISWLGSMFSAYLKNGADRTVKINHKGLDLFPSTHIILYSLRNLGVFEIISGIIDDFFVRTPDWSKQLLDGLVPKLQSYFQEDLKASPTRRFIVRKIISIGKTHNVDIENLVPAMKEYLKRTGPKYLLDEDIRYKLPSGGQKPAAHTKRAGDELEEFPQRSKLPRSNLGCFSMG